MKSDISNINVVPTVGYVDLEPKTYMVCPECGEVAEVNTNVVLTSYPPQHSWHCEHCGAHGYIQCDKIKSVDPSVWTKVRARYSKRCEICGNEILIYGDEDPKICKECRDAVIAMRKALGTWHD